MPVDIIPFEALGRFENDWLDTRYHFSFADYHDPNRMGVGPLRVWNDDRIAPGMGFDPHPHRNMEIITYVRRGAITHRDNLGNEGRTEAGDVQVMSAGTGIVHAEYNLEREPTDLFQIWIMPNERGHAPRWDTRRFPKMDRAGALVALASGRSNGGDALHIHADATLYGATLPAGQTLSVPLGSGRQAYLVPATGRLEAAGAILETRSGAAVRDMDSVAVSALEDSELLFVDLPDG
ncbi:MAG: pirin family protein [Rhodospirillaceae bacterium]|nr:pirin family protein [Rhodospirillaceae bacterium]MDD9916690.1 pirin family protein [Rhodospirillaceae bacterium]MDD9925206.1 pirin family protein [Rhodospirillaceae bacterium]